MADASAGMMRSTVSTSGEEPTGEDEDMPHRIPARRPRHIETLRSGAVPSSLRTVDEIVALYERWGHLLYDDLVSQLDHGLQCASLADAARAHDALIAASLLHDIGHLIELQNSGGRIGDLSIDRHHEATAVRVLAGLFAPAVTAPIALHVEAKRYLCAVDPTYASQLSEGSVRSLETQGGPMAPDEIARFEALPACSDACDLRRWDDLGKIEDLHVAPFGQYVGLLQSLAVR